MEKKITVHAFLHATGTVAYIVLIALFLSSAKRVFDRDASNETMMIPVIMLLLLVISAAITGFAVFGKPVMLYIDGKKRESLLMLAQTIGFLIMFAVIVVLLILR